MAVVSFPGWSQVLVVPESGYLLTSLPVFLLVLLAWPQLKNLIKSKASATQVSVDFMKFKRTQYLFMDMLRRYRIEDFERLDDAACMTFGNKDATVEVYTVTNPHCGHCTGTFEVFDELLSSLGTDFKLNIVFSVPVSQIEAESTQIARVMLEIYQQDPRKAYKAYKDWYAHKDVKAWQAQYGLPQNQDSLTHLETSKDWCSKCGVVGTPTTIISGHEFPQEYVIEDLLYLMVDLTELSKIEKPMAQEEAELV